MQQLDAFLSRLLPLVPSCPDPLARQALLDAAIEFCEETQIVQVTSEPQAVTEGLGVYDLDIGSQERVVATTKVWYGTASLSPAPLIHVNAILAYVDSAGGTAAPRGTPQVFYEFAPGSIGIYPVPKDMQANMLSARVTTKPKRTATQLNDILFDDWAETIVAGAKARIVAIPGQFFSANPAKDELAFRVGISKAKGIAIRGRTLSSLTVTQRPLA